MFGVNKHEILEMFAYKRNTMINLNTADRHDATT